MLGRIAAERRSSELCKLLCGVHAGAVARDYSELLRCAAECARGARMPVKYMDKLLLEWKRAGIETPEAARAQHGAATAAPTAAPKQNYQQHSYTEADFGEDFYYDPAKD